MPLDLSADFDKWKVHGNNYAEPEWKEGGTVSYDGLGLMTFRGQIQGRDTHDLAELQAFGIPMFGEELQSGGKGFFVSKIQKKLLPNRSAIFDIEAIGIEARCQGVTRVSAEGMSSCSTEPIETHWNWNNIGGSPDAPKNGATYDANKRFTGFSVISTPAHGTSDPNNTSIEPLAGVRSYYVPKPTFRGFFHCSAKTYSVSDINRLPSNPISNDGTISGIRLIPTWYSIAGDMGSWLLTSITPEPVVVNSEGEPVILKVSFELMKARTKWNPLIYISGAS